MKSFLKNLFAALLGNLFALGIAASLVTLAGAVFLVSLAVSLGKGKVRDVPERAFLVLDLSMNISDAPERHDAGLPSLLMAGATPRIALWDLMTAVQRAKADSRIAGLFVHGSLIAENYGSGYAAIEAVRRSIEDFKKTSGKPVIAYLEQPSLKDYYLVTAADTIYLNPFGSLEIGGLASESIYWGDALRKYGIGVQTTKVGKYKSAVEPFLSSKMSDPAREQMQVLLQGIWSRMLADISSARGVTVDALQRIADDEAILSAKQARERGLVDKNAYLDEVIAHLQKQGRSDSEMETFAQINLRDYATAGKLAVAGGKQRKVALVYAEGEIVDGWESSGTVGGHWLAGELRKLRQDDSVVGVVLRVNSPGGSAYASEVIQREMRLLAESGKPVVVSMGSLAASGGYWISAYANKIFAEETTITGSIGVFGLMFNVQEFAQGFGVNFDGVKTSSLADMSSIYRPKDEKALQVLQAHTDEIYEAFLNKVAEGRDLKRYHVAEIAQGRVWTGADGLRLGLVDELGGMDAAVAEVRKAAGAADAQVQQYPERLDAWGSFTRSLQEGDGEGPVALSPADQLHRRVLQQWEVLRNMNDRRGVYARLPYQLEIK